jgi:hypothetical protein
MFTPTWTTRPGKGADSDTLFVAAATTAGTEALTLVMWSGFEVGRAMVFSPFYWLFTISST